ncbi:MAG: twin-arginine translocase TatA/TatE family subunit [Candidatus Dormibacteria bacterium]
MLSPTHFVLLGLVLLLALVVFGPKRLPELGHSIGRAIQEFKHATEKTRDGLSSAGTELRDSVHPIEAEAAAATAATNTAPLPSNGAVAQQTTSAHQS